MRYVQTFLHTKARLRRVVRSRRSWFLLVPVLSCLLGQPASATVTPPDSHLLLYSGFEEGLDGWSPSSADASWYGPTAGAYRLGRGAAQLLKNASLTRTLDARGYQALFVRVALAGLSLERNKALLFEVQGSDGVWQTLGRLASPSDTGYYQYLQLALASGLQNQSLQLRVRLTGTLKSDYGYLDEVWVYGQPVAGPKDVRAADCPQCTSDFALYDPALEDDGVWEEEVRVLLEMFRTFGWTWQVLDHTELNAGGLGRGDARRYRGLIVPGGFATARNRDVNSTGELGIRDFLSSGGNYVGFCAGSFWAASTVTWAQTATGGGGTYNQSSDYTAYAYDLKLFTGTAQGPYGWSPWNEGTNPSLEAVTLNTQSPTLQAIGMPSTSRFFYYGGPFFVPPTPLPTGYEVWAWAQAPSGLGTAALTGAGAPVIVHFQYGSGQVVLFSHHPEVLIGSEEDGVHLITYFDESDIGWDLGGMSWDRQRLDSWNIVHAALQLAKNQSVEALIDLP